MKNMKRFLLALGTASILLSGGTMTAMAETGTVAESTFSYAPIYVYGSAEKLEDGRLHLTCLLYTSTSPSSSVSFHLVSRHGIRFKISQASASPVSSNRYVRTSII